MSGLPVLLYLASGILFILGLKQMCRMRTAERGQKLVAAGMVLAVAGVAGDLPQIPWGSIGPGIGIGALVGVAIGLGAPAGSMALAAGLLAGLAAGGAALVCWMAYGAHAIAGATNVQVVALGAGGSLGAATVLASLAAGSALVVPQSGRDASTVPIRMAILVAGAGLATGLCGFFLGNPIVVIVGGLTGSAGFALARMMAAALGRDLVGVLFGGSKAASSASGPAADYKQVRSCGAEEAAMVLENAKSVVMVPGYGMALAQAQNASHDLAKLLGRRGTRVAFAIHPAAGIIPGHMNILLDEAGVPTEMQLDLEAANARIRDADAVIVLGANDVVNPGAEGPPGTPIYGMPFIDGRPCPNVFVIKRSLRPGTVGVRNDLFELPNTMMLFGDVKKTLQALTLELKSVTAAAAT